MNKVIYLTRLIGVVMFIVIGIGATNSPGSGVVLVSNNSPRLVAADSIAGNRVLVIETSSMPIDVGKAILTIGALHRAGGVYSGDYRIKVFPYFFKNEKGRLAIVVSDESLAGLKRGKVEAIIGTATTNGKGGTTRHIEATATPLDVNHGTLKLWFMAGDRKMIFNPAYRFSGNLVANTVGPGVATNLASTFPHGN